MDSAAAVWVLLRAAELVRIGHAREAYAIDRDGTRVNPCDATAVAWSATGAIIRACFDQGVDMSRRGDRRHADFGVMTDVYDVVRHRAVPDDDGTMRNSDGLYAWSDKNSAEHVADVFEDAAIEIMSKMYPPSPDTVPSNDV